MGYFGSLWRGTLCSLILACWSAAKADAAGESSAAEYPQTTISNGVITLTIYLPDATHGFYRGPRFDGSGIIGDVTYGAHHFYEPWRVPQNPEGNDDASGPAEEFGVSGPLGYHEAKEGESCMKIGVGMITRKKEELYAFWTNYPVTQRFDWVVHSGADFVEFTQNSGAASPATHGYAYHYIKRVAVAADKPMFTIMHTLKNTGDKFIDTNWYCHNFTIIDHAAIGKDYEVEFPFAPAGECEVCAVAHVQGNKLVFAEAVTAGKELKGGFGAGRGTVEDNKVVVRNNRIKAAVEMGCDAPLKNFGFFAAPTAICPEPFIDIKIAPGDEFVWETRYTFSIPEAGK